MYLRFIYRQAGIKHLEPTGFSNKIMRQKNVGINNMSDYIVATGRH